MRRAGKADRPDLAAAPLLREAGVAAVFRLLDGADGRCRIVGGAVRNALMGEPVGDIDFATEFAAESVLERAEEAGIRAIPTGLDHGTVTLVAAKRTFEVTTLRHDVETDGRHARVAFTDDWAADAARRDFTLNAVYLNADGTLFDPLGTGLDDIAARRVRFIGDPVARIREDYLRILRFFRIHAWYGSGDPDPDGLAAVADEAGGVDRLSRERVGREMLRLLAAPEPVGAVAAMTETGVMAHVLPGPVRLDRLRKMIAIGTRLGLDADPILRLAALATDPAAVLGERLRLARADVGRIATLEGARLPRDERQARAMLVDEGPAAYRDRRLMAWSAGDRPPDDERLAALLALPDRWTPPAFPVDGNDAHAAGVAKGRTTGEALAAARKAWIDSDFTAGADDLKPVLARFAAS